MQQGGTHPMVKQDKAECLGKCRSGNQDCDGLSRDRELTRHGHKKSKPLRVKEVFSVGNNAGKRRC